MEKRFVTTNVGSSGWRQDTFFCSYAALEKVFGPPNGGSEEGKVEYEWVIRDTETGEIFTIYDWKSSSDARLLKSVEWHVGGKVKPIDFLRWLRNEIVKR